MSLLCWNAPQWWVGDAFQGLVCLLDALQRNAWGERREFKWERGHLRLLDAFLPRGSAGPPEDSCMYGYKDSKERWKCEDVLMTSFLLSPNGFPIAVWMISFSIGFLVEDSSLGTREPHLLKDFLLDQHVETVENRKGDDDTENQKHDETPALL